LNWYLTAITAAVFYAGQMLGMQRLQKSYPIPVYMAYIWLGAGTLIGLLSIRSTDSMSAPNLALVLGAAFASWVGMYAVNKAIRLQPNVGYIDAVGALRLGLIYGVSIFLFGALFEPVKLVVLAGTMVGVLLIVGLKKDAAGVADRRWVAWLLLSVVCFTLLFACIRLATARGMGAEVATSLVMVLAGGMYVATALRGGLSLRPSRDWQMIALTIVMSAIGNAAFYSSLTAAPNLAYTDAVVNLRMIILYGAALMIGADRLHPVKALGVAVTFGCAVLLG
jgi:hypothetical protein